MIGALRESIARGVSLALGREIGPERVRVPARGAEAGLALWEPADLAAWHARGETVTPSELFNAVCGADAILSLREENGWLLFGLSDAFYDALIAWARELPLPKDDMGSLALNRMLVLKRHGGVGCPHAGSIRNALWLTACAYEGLTALSRAEEALLSMWDGIVPAERAEIMNGCGEMADAACRLLCGAYTKPDKP